jgi:menaquinone-dependent protoporphyrinogen oxidase
MLNVLVTAASKHGATLDIARQIAESLGVAGIRATVVPVELVQDLDEYDAVVLGSAVYAGRWLEPAKRFVDRERPGLASRPTWLFSSGPIGDPLKPEEVPVDVPSIAELTAAREHRIFPGRIDKRLLGFAERAIVAALHVPEGDYRTWDEIREWSRSIAVALVEAFGINQSLSREASRVGSAIRR